MKELAMREKKKKSRQGARHMEKAIYDVCMI